jgi:predicted metal-dependent HD superfamily phosphohydrolase
MHFTPAEETHILTRASLHDLPCLDQVKAKYQEPHRHYHDWNHALAVLSWVNHCCDDVFNDRPVYLTPKCKREMSIAALFHDVIYTTQGSPGNEQDSVWFLQSQIAHIGEYQEAEKMILTTAKHGKLEFEDVAFPTALLMDCDIASFGEPRWEIAVWNDQNIIKEFLQKYTMEQVKVGRKAFLEGLLAKRSIFLTPYFQDRFEAQARQNIRRLITELERMSPPPGS